MADDDDNGNEPEDCSRCGGQGFVPNPDAQEAGEPMTCPACGGSGTK